MSLPTTRRDAWLLAGLLGACGGSPVTTTTTTTTTTTAGGAETRCATLAADVERGALELHLPMAPCTASELHLVLGKDAPHGVAAALGTQVEPTRWVPLDGANEIRLWYRDEVLAMIELTGAAATRSWPAVVARYGATLGGSEQKLPYWEGDLLYPDGQWVLAELGVATFRPGPTSPPTTILLFPPTTGEIYARRLAGALDPPAGAGAPTPPVTPPANPKPKRRGR